MTSLFAPRTLVFLALFAVGLAPVGRADEEPSGDEQPLKHDRPYLWVVEGPTRVFLFGTIHVPEKRILDLPEIVTAAFDASDTVTTELALDPAAQVETNRLSMELSALPEGKTLKGVLPEALYRRVEALLPAQVQLSALDSRQPWFAWFLLLQLQLLPYAEYGHPLDNLLYARAMEAGKEVGGIETAAEQLKIFAGLTLEEQVRLLELSLPSYEQAKAQGRDLIAELIELYLKGREDAFLEEMRKEWSPEDPLGAKLFKAVLDDRNVRMADAVSKKIAAEPDKTHFFAVGTGHMAGEAGIPRLLEKQGLKVRRLLVTDTLPEARATQAPDPRR